MSCFPGWSAGCGPRPATTTTPWPSPIATHRRQRAGAPGDDAAWVDSVIAYDLGGNKVAVTQETGHGTDLTARYRYDATGRLAAQVTDPADPAHEVTYGYDDEGRQTARIDHRQTGGDPALACGDAGATCVEVRRATTAYNPDGTRRSMVSKDHQSGESLAECNYPEGATDLTSGYDPDGHRVALRSLTGTEDCSGGVTERSQILTWGHEGWLSSTTQAVRSPASGAMVTRAQSFAYDPAGKLTAATHDGRTTTYASDLAGRMITATDWRGWQTSVSHHPSGDRRAMTLGAHDANHVGTGAFEYHPSGEASALRWSTTAGTVRAHTGVAYDADGMRRGEDVAVVHPAAAPGDPGGRAEYDYDVMGRLKDWTSPFSTSPGAEERPRTTYDLDDAGNIETETTTTGTDTATTTSTYQNNQLKTRTAGGVTTNFEHNTVGEETNRTNPSLNRASTYDPAGHTARVSDATSQVDYAYDSENRLLARTGSGPAGDTRMQFYWGESNSLAEETDGSGVTTMRYLVDSGFQALANEGREGWSWLLPDIEGNVATLVGDDGAVKEQKAYSPYGTKDQNGSRGEPADPAQARTRLGFQGAQVDDKTGNVLLGPRQYDPTTTRFTTPDDFVAGDLDLELGLDPLTGNRYLFAGANPTMFYEDGYRWGWCKKFWDCDDKKKEEEKGNEEEEQGEGKPPEVPAPRGAGSTAGESGSLPPDEPWTKGCVFGERKGGGCRGGNRHVTRHSGKVWRNMKNAPSSTVGYGIAQYNGADCDWSKKRGMAVCTDARGGYRHGGTTYGSVYVTGEPSADARMLRHEAKHANQYAWFGGGAGFPVAYGAAEWASGGGDKNPFERQAGLTDGCYRPREGC